MSELLALSEAQVRSLLKERRELLAELDALHERAEAAEAYCTELRQWAVKACERDKTLPRFPIR